MGPFSKYELNPKDNSAPMHNFANRQTIAFRTPQRICFIN
jgi:hypothetical protein